MDTTTTTAGFRGATGPRLLVAVLLALHGTAHLAGVTLTVQQLDDGEAAELLGGWWTLSSDAGLWVLAAAWAVLGVAVLVSAVLVATRSRRARRAVTMAATGSLVVCAVALWGAWIGLVVSAVVLAVARRNPLSVFAGAPRGPIVDVDAARSFLAQERIAVVGASTDRRKFGNTVYRALRDHGYDVVPVNVAATQVEGDDAYVDLAAVPGDVDGVLVMVRGAAAVDAVEQSAARGVRRVWLFRGLGDPGALSAEALEACQRAGVEVVAGACPLMFLEPVGSLHRAHRAVRVANGSLGRVA